MRNTTDSDFSSLSCIFVLSTGRCGTKTLAALFNLSRQALALHEPRPLLYGLSKLCYQGFSSSNGFELLKETFLTCRSDLFRYAFSINKTYLETSPQTTFLAPIIIDALNNVKFIHVTRDPKSFVRSGMRRGWYQNHAMDNTRIVPNPASAACISWPEFNHFDKILWLWRETNIWIHNFLKRIDPQRYFFCQAEDLFSMNQVVLDTLFKFIGASPPHSSKIKSILSHRLNRQTSGSFPLSKHWDLALVNSYNRVIGPAASKFGYDSEVRGSFQC